MRDIICVVSVIMVRQNGETGSEKRMMINLSSFSRLYVLCEMSQKRPLIRSTLVLAFERGKEEEECKAKESKKKINALRLSSIIFVVALVYVVVYVVVNSLIEDIIEKNFAYSFLCLTSLKKKKRGNLSVCLCSNKKKGKTPTTFFGIQQQQNELFYTHHKSSLKAKKKTRKKENERRGSGNV